MEILMSWLGVMFRATALIVVALGTGVYCLWAVLWNKMRQWSDKINERKESRT